MSRTRDFMKFDDEVYQDVGDLLEDYGVTADLLRPASQSGDGFEQEVGEPQQVDRILIYLTQDKEKSGLVGVQVQMPVKRFFALTNYSDIYVGDILRVNKKNYVVRDVNKSFKSNIQLKLELK